MSNLQREFDGDAGFFGIDTRTNPATLKTGILQDGNNIRLDLSTLQIRKGLSRLLDESQAYTIGDVLGSGIYVRKNGTEKIVLLSATGLYLFDINSGNLSSKYPLPIGRTLSATKAPYEIIQAVDKIYILRGEATSYIYGNGTTGQKISVSSGGHLLTVTTLLPHGLSVGSEFSLEASHPEWCGPTTSEPYIVETVPNSNTFTFSLVTAHNGGDSSYVIQVGPPVFVFDGTAVNIVKQGIVDGSIRGGTTPTTCDFPNTSTAIYQKNRIYCKYSKDEIAVSDYLPDGSGNWLYDLSIQALSVNIGDEQDITGFHPWTRDEILVFKTNSIYAIKFADDTSTPDIVLANSYVRTLTYDIGCIAKNSIANVSGWVFFLSQKGIYKLDPQLDTNLLANTAPLSFAIQKYVDRINHNYSQNAVSTVFNGRYYLAVPLDNSTVNNAVFVYNLTNQMWESVDTYPSNFSITGMVIAKYGTTSISNRLLFWTKTAGVYLTEELDADQTGNLINGVQLPVYLPFSLTPIVYASTQIGGYAKTRRYMFNTLQNKKYVSLSTDLDFNGTGVLKTTAVGYNPDTRTEIDIATSASRSDKTRRFPIRKIAVGLDVELTSLQSRPTVKSVAVEAMMIGRNLHNEE